MSTHTKLFPRALAEVALKAAIRDYAEVMDVEETTHTYRARWKKVLIAAENLINLREIAEGL